MPRLRRLGLRLIAVVLLAALGLAGSLAAADARSKRTCKLKNSKTYRSNSQVRLFTRKETRETLLVTALYGCHRKTKKRVFLATRGGYNSDGFRVKLRGRFVAANFTETDSRSQPSRSSGFLREWDLGRPKRLENIKDVAATDIEMGPQGQLFWIGRPLVDGGQPEPPLSVRAGKDILATGNIEPKSLVLGAQLTVSWTQDGVRRCSGRPACTITPGAP